MLQRRGLREQPPATRCARRATRPIVAGTSWLFARERDGRAVRLPVHRRGRTGRAGRCRGDEPVRPQHGAARRPAAVAARHAGHPSWRCGRLGARAPARQAPPPSPPPIEGCSSSRRGGCIRMSAPSSRTLSPTRAGSVRMPGCAAISAIDSTGLAGTGLRYLPVRHTGNAQQSPGRGRRHRRGQCAGLLDVRRASPIATAVSAG